MQPCSLSVCPSSQQDLERLWSFGCWHLVEALPIDRATLWYWPVCWKDHLSHFISTKEHQWLITCAALSSLKFSIFAVSFYWLQDIFCMYAYVFILIFPNLASQMFGLFLSVCHVFSVIYGYVHFQHLCHSQLELTFLPFTLPFTFLQWFSLLMDQSSIPSQSCWSLMSRNAALFVVFSDFHILIEE